MDDLWLSLSDDINYTFFNNILIIIIHDINIAYQLVQKYSSWIISNLSWKDFINLISIIKERKNLIQLGWLKY